MIYIGALILTFSVTTAISIILIGGRNLIGLEMTPLNLVKIIFDWHFIVGALFAFFSRLIFMMINSAIYKIPHLSIGSTTITTFVTSFAMVFVIAANYYYLGERLNLAQGIGAFVILAGIFIIMR